MMCALCIYARQNAKPRFLIRPYLSGSKKIATAAEMLIILMVALALKKSSRYIGAPSHLLSVIIYFWIKQQRSRIVTLVTLGIKQLNKVKIRHTKRAPLTQLFLRQLRIQKGWGRRGRPLPLKKIKVNEILV